MQLKSRRSSGRRLCIPTDLRAADLDFGACARSGDMSARKNWDLEMELNMRLRQFSGFLLVATLFGCSNSPKERTEFEKQLDAVPMPTTETGRQQQCTNLSRAAFGDFLEHAAMSKQESLFKPGDYTKSVAINRRMVAMNCTKGERQPWLGLLP